MALIESLLAEISDPALREALEREVRDLKDRTDFGLFFERHLPESVLLPPNVGLEVGTEVRVRQRPNDQRRLYVRKLLKTRARIAESGDEDEESVAIKDLRVVRRFDQPVYPTLRSLAQLGEGSRDPDLVINAENFDALQLLRFTHAGRVDVIYIDPPYNTGARDWSYNNAYVDSNDRFRHSKWLSFMEKRLQLAKALLKSDGVLIVTIGEHEVSHLGVLLEDVFPEYLRYLVTIVHNPKGTAKVNFGRVAEYAFFVVPDTGDDVITFLPPPDDEPDPILFSEAEEEPTNGSWIGPVDERGLVRLPRQTLDALEVGGESDGMVEISLRPDEGVTVAAHVETGANADEPKPDGGEAEEGSENLQSLHLRRRGAQSSYREQRHNSFYAIKVNEKTRTVVGVGPELEKSEAYELDKREGDVVWIYPIDEAGKERVWRYSRTTMQHYIDNGEIKVGTYWPNKPQRYTLNHLKRREGERVQRLRTVWWRKDHDAGTHGTNLVSKLLGKPSPFPFPKSLYAVRDCLEAVVADRPDALIVDFFAGSGTTLHATWLLNEADEGNRRCILVTNNELDGDTADELQKQGHFPGDAEFEARGVFEAATKPRIEAALTGRTPDGTAFPETRRFRYSDGRYWAEGFEENVEFVGLDYLDPDALEIGQGIDDLVAVLWLRSGARGPMPPSKLTRRYTVFEEAGFAVLGDEGAFLELVREIADNERITHVFVVTDYNDTFAGITSRLPGRRVEMVPRTYLDWFQRHTGPAAS